jgi:hypothetical protein
MALAVLMALAGFGLAGCETSASLFGSNSPAHGDCRAHHRRAQPPLAKVAVAPIVGAPDAIAKQIQQEFTSAVEKQRVSVTASKDERADYTCAATSSPPRTSPPPRCPTSGMSPIRPASASTASPARKSSPAMPPRTLGPRITPQVAQSIAGKAANSFVAWLPSQSSRRPVASSVERSQRASARTSR